MDRDLDRARVTSPDGGCGGQRRQLGGLAAGSPAGRPTSQPARPGRPTSQPAGPGTIPR
ncbi:MAG: hypothetical protein ACLP5E_11470 [Streptosporangiaceae bacterium]